MSDKAFYGVSEAAKLLDLSVTALTAAIDSGKLPALKLGTTHAATRIRHTDLFPDERTTRDLRHKRITRLMAQARDAKDKAHRLRLEMQAAEEEADRLYREVERDLLTDRLDIRTADAA